MPKYLKSTRDGTVYPWTRQLAERADMEPYEFPAVTAPQTVEADASESENTSQNSESASAELSPDPQLSSAVEAFRRQVTGRRKSAKQVSTEGEK